MDYYKTLGLSKSATHQDIKNQYRKLVNIHHPDKNGGSIDSEIKFKSILEAYEVLSDPFKKQKYDSSQIKRTDVTLTRAAKDKGNNHHINSKMNIKTVLIFVGLFILMWFISTHKKIEKKREVPVLNTNRPNTGEIDFK